MEKPKNKKRASNYTSREKEIIVSLVEKYLDVLENKKTNAVFNKQKAECWEKLSLEYNALQTSGLRTGFQLKQCYEQLKKTAKQHKAEDKVETLKTGGGAFTPKLNNIDDKILNLLKNNYFSIQNKYDSNAGPSSESTFNNDEAVEHIEYNISENESVPHQNYKEQGRGCQHLIEEEDIDLSMAMESLQDISNSQHSPPNKIRKKDYEREKKKSGNQTAANKKRVNKESDITLKKIEILNLKISVLNTIKETEIENLKGKKLDNEIKEIIKEKELLELQIKKIEFNKLMPNNI